VIGRLLELRQSGEARAVRDPAWGRWAKGGDLGMPGAQINADKALNLLVVYGCVQLIADSIATLPLDVLDNGTPIDPPAWLENPAPLDRIDFINAITTSLLLEGNAFVAVGRNTRGAVASLDPIAPHRVDVEIEGSKPSFSIDGQPAPMEILMIRGLMMPGRVRGLSPVEYARQSIGLGLGAQEQAERFYRQGAVVPGIIHSKSDLSPDQMREVRDQWLSAHGGSNRAHLPVVLSGDTSWQSITMTAEQAQFLESRQFAASEIASMMFLVDPSEFGLSVTSGTLTYQNLEQRGVHLVRRTLLRWIIRIERGLGALLPPSQILKFNVNGIQRGDLSTRYASYEAAARINGLLGAPLLSVQEMRDLENLGPMQDSGLTPNREA
jgi:HK97 family phage portal protein